MDFIKTVCIDKEHYDGEKYRYDDFAFGDYVTFALWDITDKTHPKRIMCADNTHTNIEAEIDAFIKGVSYCIDLHSYSSENVLLCDSELDPVFDFNNLIETL